VPFSPRSATELAEEYFRAWLAADEAALAAVLSPHVTFDGPLGSAKDRDACVQGLLGMRSSVVSDLVVQTRVASDHDVLTWFDLHSEVAPPTATVNWSHVSDGLIDEIRVTFDPRALLAGLAVQQTPLDEQDRRA